LSFEIPENSHAIFFAHQFGKSKKHTLEYIDRSEDKCAEKLPFSFSCGYNFA